jgi:hypothetical protein
VTHERFRLPQLDAHIDMGSGTMSIGRYFTEMLDPTMNWDDVAEMVREWGRSVLPEGRDVGGRRAPRRRHRLRRRGAVQPRRPPARRQPLRLRPARRGGRRLWATGST